MFGTLRTWLTPPGQQRMVLDGLPEGTRYIGMRTFDASNNRSDIAQVVVQVK